jgi:hypothetical protein
MTDWQPIATAPRDGTHILAYGWEYTTHYSEPGRMQQREIWCKWNNTWMFVEADGGLFHREPCRSDEHWEPCRTFNPTHWMPLPEPPPEED